MMMDEPDRQHALRILNWLSEAVYDKYQKGVAHHGGHLPNKGGLLREAECEVLDQAVYVFTIREQLLRVEKWVEYGECEKALIALHHILHGTPADTLPTD
jgi:hypothetical protein